METNKSTKIGPMVGASAHSAYKRPEDDYYATDPEALVKFIGQYNADGERLHNQVWECACGEGNLSEVLLDLGHTVFATDKVNRGNNHTFDFVTPTMRIEWSGDILTNPPYKTAQEFIESALERVKVGNKVIMLLRIQFLESQRRHEFFKAHPPKYVYVHSSRIQIRLNNDPSINNSALCFAWFVWQKGYTGSTTIRWIR